MSKRFKFDQRGVWKRVEIQRTTHIFAISARLCMHITVTDFDCALIGPNKTWPLKEFQKIKRISPAL